MPAPTSTHSPCQPVVTLESFRNVVRKPFRTCGVCATPVEGYPFCWRCRQHRRTTGVADVVAPLIYAIDGASSAAVLRNYKNHPARAERERCARIVGELLRSAMSHHQRCIGSVVGQPVASRVVIPSLTSRMGTHPMVSIAQSLGLLGDVQLRPSHDTRCDRVVDASKFIVDGAVAGRHIMVIDDVWTTGSNAQSASLALRRAGASAVSVIVISRWLNARHPLCVRLIRDQLRNNYDPLVCPVTGHRCT
jgi:phosphoribosylpyrophosphate synthetase